MIEALADMGIAQAAIAIVAGVFVTLLAATFAIQWIKALVMRLAFRHVAYVAASGGLGMAIERFGGVMGLLEVATRVLADLSGTLG